MQQLSVSECIRFGWETFKKRPFFLIAVLIGVTIANFIITSVPGAIDPEGDSIAIFLFSILVTAFSIAVEIALLRFTLRAHDSIETVQVKDGLPAKPFWKYIGAQIVVAVAVLIGLILLIVPGIIAMLAFFMTQYLVVERKLWPIEAMKESARITKGNRWKLFLLLLAIIGINIVGFLALIVGLLVTIPVSMLALAHAYRMLEHKANEVAPAPAAMPNPAPAI